MTIHQEILVHGTGHAEPAARGGGRGGCRSGAGSGNGQQQPRRRSTAKPWDAEEAEVVVSQKEEERALLPKAAPKPATPVLAKDANLSPASYRTPAARSPPASSSLARSPWASTPSSTTSTPTSYTFTTGHCLLKAEGSRPARHKSPLSPTTKPTTP